jgi:hypothetical protein
MTETTPTPAQAPAPADQRSVGRSVAVVVCLVLAALLTVPAGFAYWGQRTINDGARYVATVGPLVDSPEVQDAIATKVSDALESQVDVEALLNEAFAGVITKRPRLQALIGPLSGAVNGLIESQVRDFIASDTFRALWLAANTKAQAALLELLRGNGSGAVSIQGGQVVLDLGDVIDQVKQRLVDRGLTIIQQAPPLPIEQRQIVLLESPQLKKVRTAYALSNPVARWLLPVVALLYLAALVLSRRRARTAVVIGILIAANAVLIALLLSIGRQLFIDQLTGTDFGPASRVFYDQLLTYLERGQRTFLWFGLVVAVAGWFAGRSRLGTSVRTTTAQGLESVGSTLGDTQAAGAGRWTLANAGWLRVVAAVVGLVVLTWGNNASPTRLFWSLVVVVVLLAAIQVLVGVGRAAPGAGVPPVSGPGGDGDGDERTLPLPTGGTA